MKRLFIQLGKLLGRDRDSAPDIAGSAGSARTVQIPPSRHRSTLLAQEQPRESKPFDIDEIGPEADFGTRIEDIGPGKTVLRSSYLLNPRDDEEPLELADPSDNDDADTSFDPYNSGQFDRSRNWSKHPRK